MPSQFFVNMLKPKVPPGIALFDENCTKSSGDCKNNDEAFNSRCDNVTKKIRHLLDCYPSGIRLESLCDAFRRRFSEDLKPTHYGFTDMENLIRAIPSVAKLTVNQEGSGFIISSVNGEMMNSKLPTEADAALKCTKENDAEVPPAQNEVEGTDKTGIHDINDIQVEGEMMNSKLPTEADAALKCTKENYAEVPPAQNEVEGTDKTGIQDINEIQVEDVVEPSSYMIPSPVKDKLTPLPDESKENLKDLLKNHFPGGLTLNELIGAYRGFFGATLEDLDPSQYGYCSLEEMLKAKCDFATLKYCGGEIMLHYIDSSASKCDNSDNSILVEDTWDVKPYISLPAVNAVEPGSRYKSYNAHELYQPETMSEVVVGEVFSPSDFYIIHRGIDTSQALDALMDQMLEFYSSPIGERYKINEKLEIGAPVAALYKEDDNWYRAIVTGHIDLVSVKLFFCDYGTKSFGLIKSLRKLHNKFFDLPVQAIQGRLHGIKPVNDARRLWPRKSSKRLLELLQDKALVANIIKVEPESVYMSLWDTSDSDINVSDILVSEGLAKCEEGTSLKEVTEEKNSVYSNHSNEIPPNSVTKQLEMPQHPNEDINILTEQIYSSNLCNTKISGNISNSENKTNILSDMEPFDNSSLSTNFYNNEQNKSTSLEISIKCCNDSENSESITEENLKLNFLLEECNKLLRREKKSTEGMSTADCQEIQANDMNIRIIENGTSEIDQPKQILASTPRHDISVANETLDLSSISQTVTPKKAPSVPPGFDIHLNLPSSASSIPPGYTSLPKNFNEIPIIPQQLQMGTDNAKITPLSYLKHKFPIETQSVDPENTISIPLLNQKKHELPMETQYFVNNNVGLDYKTQFTRLTSHQLSTSISASPGFGEFPISNSLSKEEQNIQDCPKTTLEDETFFSDEELGGSSLSLNVGSRTVECFSLMSNYTVHILKLSGAPYILSGEISQVLWDSDKLRIALAKKKKDLPFIILNQKTHPDIFQELIKLKAASALDNFGEPLMSLFAYPLQVVPRILKIFKNDHGAVMKAFQDLMMIYKEDPDYIPFDESFVWPDNECSSPNYPIEDSIINVESASNLITDSKKNEKDGMHGSEDRATFGSKIKVPSSLIEAIPISISDEIYNLKNDELMVNQGLTKDTYNEKLDRNFSSYSNLTSKDCKDTNDLYAGIQIKVGEKNIVDISDGKSIEDKVLSNCNAHHIKDQISSCISSDTNFIDTEKIKPSYRNIGSNISCNSSNKSLIDIDIDNFSNKSTSDSSTFLTDTSNLSPETKSLHAIKKRMSLMYKKKQSNLQNLLMNDSNKPYQNIKKIKLPKEFAVVHEDLKSNENNIFDNLPHGNDSNYYNSSYNKEKVMIDDTLNNSQNVSQATNNKDLKTNSEIETIFTNTSCEIEKINSNSNNTITILNDPVHSLCDPYSFNFTDSIQYEHMFKDMNYFHDDNDLKIIPPPNAAVHNSYPQSNSMRYPNFMPHLLPRMGYMQGLPCIYYPVPTPMFPMASMPQKYYKHK